MQKRERNHEVRKMTDKQVMHDYLVDCLLKLESKEECEALLSDLCTYAETDNMAQRVYSAKLILDGLTYNEVIEKTQISSATLSRVSRCVKHGDGGYKRIIDKTR